MTWFRTLCALFTATTLASFGHDAADRAATRVQVQRRLAAPRPFDSGGPSTPECPCDPSMPNCTTPPSTCDQSQLAQTYYGGHVIANVKVYVVNWSAAVDTATTDQLGPFYAAATNSDWLDAKSEYGTSIAVGGGSHAGSQGTGQIIGRGTFAGAITIAPALQATSCPDASDASRVCVADADITRELDAQISAGTLPQPDANTIYMTYFPPHFSIAADASSKSCEQFCAYHSTFLHNGQSTYYGIFPDFGASGPCSAGCGNGTTLQNLSSASSHELAEAMVDGEVGLVTGNGLDYPAGFSNDLSGEIGDMCNQHVGTVTAPSGGAQFTVQQTYSSRLNQCVITLWDATDFRFFAEPNTATVAAGESVTIPLTLATAAGAAQDAIALSATTPAGVTASFSETSVASDSTPTLTLTADPGAAPLKDAVVVLTAKGATTRTSSVLLQVGAGSGGTDGGTDKFAISIAPSSQTAAPGDSVDYSVQTAVVSGAPGDITLTVKGLPAGVTGAFDTSLIAAGGNATLTLTIDAAAPVTAAQTFTVDGSSGGATVGITGTIAVTSGVAVTNTFTLALSPASKPIFASGTAAFTVSTRVATGTAESITLAADGLPAEIAASFNPPTVKAGQSSVLTLTATAASLGTTTFDVTGMAASDSQQASADVVVTAGDFSLSITPASRGIAAGASADYTVSTKVKTGSPEPIALSIGDLPPGVSAAFSADTVNSGGSATLTLTVDNGTSDLPSTQFTVTATADSGATHDISAAFSIGATAGPSDFSLTLSPAAQKLEPGGTAGFTVGSATVSGTAESIALSVAGLPAGVTAAFQDASIAAGATTQLTLTAGSFAAPGNATFTVTGKSPSATHTATGSLGTLSAPVVSITEPAGGAVSGTVSIGATASTDPATSLARIELYSDAVLLGAATASPGTVSWNTRGTANGAHALTAKAFDAAGFSATSKPVSVTVSNTVSLSVAVTSPSDGQTVSGAVTLTALATGQGVTVVSLLVDAQSVGSASAASASVQWDSTTVADGAHVITAEAKDAAGDDVSSLQVAVTVANGAAAKKSGGCSTGSGGFEVLGLAGLALAWRRRRARPC
jgi:hypothetical protein